MQLKSGIIVLMIYQFNSRKLSRNQRSNQLVRGLLRESIFLIFSEISHNAKFLPLR